MNPLQTLPTFDIRAHVEKLTPAKGRDRYICPVCGGNDLTIDPKDGAYQCWGGCECKDIRDEIAPLLKLEPKAIRPKADRTFVYTNRQGEPQIRVRRTDDGKGNRQIWQEYWHGKLWQRNVSDSIKAAAKKAIATYRHLECIEAAKSGQPVFWVEGEPCADALWAIGIAATATIGGSSGYPSYGDYSKDFQGFDLVISPDRDLAGIKYAEAIARDYPDAQWLYAHPDSQWWNRLPKEGGLDVKDWIDDGATKEQILGAIEERRNLSLEPKPSGESIATRIKDLLDQGLSETELQEEKIKLRVSSGVGDRELNNLWNTLEEERNLKETQGDRHRDLEKLLSIQDYSLSLKGILHPSLAEPIEKIAGWLGSSPEAFLTTLLPTIGTLAWAGTSLMLMSATDFKALAILWAGLVAESGLAKSPTQKLILKALFKLQAEEDENYEGRLKRWEDECREASKNDAPKPNKPTVREFYIRDATSEAVAKVQSEQPDRGCLLWMDELSTLVSSQNVYRGGKGGDREALLSSRDGTGLKTNRAGGKRISTATSNNSITGGIQPDTLKKLMGDFSDGTGQWARLQWCFIPPKPASYVKPEEAGSTINDLQTRLYSLYSLVQTYPAKQYNLSPEAEELYESWFNQLDELRMKEDRQAFRAVYSKAKGNTGEIALLLHLTNSAAMGLRITDDLISPHTMKAAIALMKFYIGQVKLIHSLGDEQRGEITPLLAKIIDLSKRKGDVSARDCKAGIAALRNEDVAKIRGYFRDLAEGGYGVLTGSGDRVKLQASVDKSKTVDKKSSTASTVDLVSDTAITDDIAVDNLSTPLKPYAEPTSRQTVDTVDDFPLSNKSGGFNKGDRVLVVDPNSEWHLMQGVVDRKEGTNGSSQYYVEGENSSGRSVATWLKGMQLAAEGAT